MRVLSKFGDISDGFSNGQIGLKQDLKAMKRSITTKEPHLEVEEVTEGHNNSSDRVDGSISVKNTLRRRIEFKQQRRLLQAASEESSLKKVIYDYELLREWSYVVNSAGYFCEVRPLVSDLSPFPESLDRAEVVCQFTANSASANSTG